MMSKRFRWATVAAGLVLLLFTVGCGGSDSGDEARSASETQTEDVSTAPDESTPEATAPEPEPPAEPTRPGTVMAGSQVFEQSCSGCHARGGRAAAFGPRLAGQGLADPEIRRIVVNGQNQMPAGLVEGQDLEDIVVYVASLQ